MPAFRDAGAKRRRTRNPCSLTCVVDWALGLRPRNYRLNVWLEHASSEARPRQQYIWLKLGTASGEVTWMPRGAGHDSL